MNSTAQPRWTEAALRGLVLGAVAAAHLLALMVALVPAGYWQPHGREVRVRDDALQLHLLPLTHRQPPSKSLVLPVLPKPAPATRPRVKRLARVSRAANAVPATDEAPPLDLALPPPAAGYETGGADFHGRLEDAKRALPVARLPGAGMPLVAGLPFADPKSQGAAGLVRGLQHLFGLPNKHCIDVDVWRNMTRQELLKRHISDQDVERVAAENGCL